MPEDGTPAPDPLLAGIAARLRAARKGKRLTRRALSAAAGVSERYLAQLEGATGNASISVLARLADALGTEISALIAPTDPLADALARASARQRAQVARVLTPSAAWGGRVALIGLRGAGKSTLGPMLARHLNLPFQELNATIADEAGIPAGEVMALYGEGVYRRRERDALAVLAQGPPMVLAVSGGIVADTETYELLLNCFLTIWLQAQPQEHMARVKAQGDDRPMRDNPQAMAELNAILEDRTPAYARARLTTRTSGRTPEQTLEVLLKDLNPLLSQQP